MGAEVWMWLLALWGCGSSSDLDPCGQPALGRVFVELDVPADEVDARTDELSAEFDLWVIHRFHEVARGFVGVTHPDGVYLEDEPGVQAVFYEQSVCQPFEEWFDVVEVMGEVPPNVDRIGGPYTGAGLENVHVAVVDSGIAEHPDLNVVARVDLTVRSPKPSVETEMRAHGTHVAGTLGARANGAGVVGVAPGVPLHDVRITDANGSIASSELLAALEYVALHPEIRVVNASVGGFQEHREQLERAIDLLVSRGVIVVVSAGNEGWDANETLPAAVSSAITVSAYDASAGDVGFADFSNHGHRVDITAPGVGVPSTWVDGTVRPLDGTSMAAPAVAGVAAAYLASHPEGTPHDFRERLVDTAFDNLTGASELHPEGMVNGPGVWGP